MPLRTTPRAVGIAVETFHVRRDPELEARITRTGRGRITSYQVCDFNLPIAADALLSRGMMGDGVIDFATIGTWVRDAGYTGDIEVEIFNQEIRDADGDDVLDRMKDRCAALFQPFAWTRPLPLRPSAGFAWTRPLPLRPSAGMVAPGGEAMDKQVREARASVVIAAPPERVWAALTDPADVREYFLGTQVTSSWREGEPVTFEGEWQGKSYRDKGTVLEARPNELLRITHYSPLSGLPDEPGNYHTVEYVLEPVAEGTRVSIAQGNNKSDDEAAESEKLWGMVLGNLKEYLED